MTGNNLSATKKALLALQEMKEKLRILQYDKTEPIAIIGIGCHFPGEASSPDYYWQLLKEGKDTSIEIPSNRFDIDKYYDFDPDVPGKMYNRFACFLSEPIDEFDPQFFGISPREANCIDPQHRILLETTWNALENANIVPESLFNSLTGVFVGIASFEHAISMFSPSNITNIDGYYGTGTSLGAAAGRISYLFGLTGPSLIIDTACSSSLVTTHLACQSLRLKECNLAIAGGVNLLTNPEVFINFAKARMLSPDGKSKAFDKNADGYGRGEGCGVIILKRLSDAIKDGDKILAQIQGSAVNQDGLSGGLTVPNGPSQEKVMRKALENSGLKPDQITYIEAHGTGTSLGDPIEMGAIGNVYGKNRSWDNLLYVGSVKSNIGHLESAASIASIIKVVLSLKNKQIPPHLHFKTPNPLIDWNSFPVKIPTSLTLWNVNDRRIAGVSSFSFSGTNAHILIEEAPDIKIESEQYSIQTKRNFHLLTLSAKSFESLKELAVRYEKYLSINTNLDLADICFTSNTRRTHFNYRFSVTGNSAFQIADKLKYFYTENNTDLSSYGKIIKGKTPKIAFLFTGQGSQYINMGKELFETNSVFRNTLQKCSDILNDYLEVPLLKVIYPDTNQSSLIDNTAYTQPALFAFEYSIAKVWESWGIKPDIVMGHSVGEYVAACIAGVFSLNDGLKLISERGRLMQNLCETGDMIVVLSNFAAVEKIIKPYKDSISIAAINGNENIVISGQPESINEIKPVFEKNNIEIRKLNVSHAFHSSMMKPMISPFEKFAQTLNYYSPKITIYSNLTGDKVTNEIADHQYWCKHILNPVQFYSCIKKLSEDNVKVFLEIGPKPTLLGMAQLFVPEDKGLWLPSLRYGHDEYERMFLSLSELYKQGANIDWHNIDKDYKRKTVQLPNYPFQKQRCWRPENLSSNFLYKQNYIHPLLGEKKSTPLCKNNEIIYETILNPNKTDFLDHHSVFDMIVFPAAGHVEMILAAGFETFKTKDLVISDFFIQNALILPHDEPKTVQIILTPKDNLQYFFQIFSLENDTQNDEWIFHTSGFISKIYNDVPKTKKIEEIISQCENEISIDYYYEEVKNAGIEHGEKFQSLKKIMYSQDKNQIIGKIQLPLNLTNNLSNFYLHPVLLDGCFQMSGVPLLEKNNNETWLPVYFDKLIFFQKTSKNIFCYMTKENDLNTNIHCVDLNILTPEGNSIAKIKGLQFHKADIKTMKKTLNMKFRDWLYEIQWEPVSYKHFSSINIPDPKIIKESLQTEINNFIHIFDVYSKADNNLNNLCIEYILMFFHNLGWIWKKNSCFTTQIFMEQLKISSKYLRFMNRILSILNSKNIIIKKSENDFDLENIEWQIVFEPEINDLKNNENIISSEFPELLPELNLLKHCALSLTEVMQGKIDPVEVLFPDNDFSIVRNFYYNSRGLIAMNTIIKKSLESVIRNFDKKDQIRILEIGAGTGCTTSYILPELPADRTEYSFTDISHLFLDKARDQFKNYPFISYDILNIEKNPEAQGFDLDSFNIIIASNVLHATKFLNETLDNINKLLCPGGLLIVLESTTKHIWIDLIFGLTDGWWRFEDVKLRPDHPIMPINKWLNLFKEKGFESQAAISPDERQQVVYIAQKSKQEIADKKHEKWIIFADKNEIGNKLSERIKENKWDFQTVLLGDKFEKLDNSKFIINPYSYDDYEHVFKESNINESNLKGIFFCWGLDTIDINMLTLDDLKNIQHNCCGSLLNLIHALDNNNISKLSSLFIVTKGAVPVNINETQIINSNVAQSTLWGFGRSIQSEKPDLNVILIDLDSQNISNDEDILYQEIKKIRPGNQIAFRNNCRYEAKLKQYNEKAFTDEKKIIFNDEKSYLITGGLGDLGLFFAKWMVESLNVKYIILLGRSTPDLEAINKINILKESGAFIEVVQADVASYSQLSNAISKIEKKLPPLKGIIHAAGVLDDAVIENQNWTKFERVISPKIYGAWNLHKLSLDIELDFFILFSSVSSIIGSPGQSNYASANAYLDSLSNYRRSKGLPALCINWGRWSEIGQAADMEIEQRLNNRGILSISPNQGLIVFEHLLYQNTDQIIVMPVNWDLFAQWAYQPFYSYFKKEQKTKSIEHIDFFKKLSSLSGIELREFLTSFLQSQITKILLFKDEQSIDIHDKFFDIGMDSLTALELKNRMQIILGRMLPSTLLFKYTTIDKLVDYMYELLNLDEEGLTDKNDEGQSDNDEEDIFDEIKGLTDDDLEALIDEEIESLIDLD